MCLLLWVPCCEFSIPTMFGSSLPPVVSKRDHVLLTLFVFACGQWRPTYIVSVFFTLAFSLSCVTCAKARGIFRLQTSDLGLQTSKFRLQISELLFPDFIRHWFLHFNTKQKIPLAFRRYRFQCLCFYLNFGRFAIFNKQDFPKVLATFNVSFLNYIELVSQLLNLYRLLNILTLSLIVSYMPIFTFRLRSDQFLVSPTYLGMGHSATQNQQVVVLKNPVKYV